MARSTRSLLVLCLVVVGLGFTTAAPPAAADGGDAPGAPLAFRSISSGEAHSCAILENGRVKCWGSSPGGAMGYGDAQARGDGPGEMGDHLPNVDLGPGRTATALALGEFHTCALLDNGQVKCWGPNGSGQLGLGDTVIRGNDPGEMGAALPAVDLGTGRTALALASGATHTCALLDNHSVKCWGAGSSGHLGYGDTANRGDGPGEMGNALPAVDLGTGRSAVAIAAGFDHTCALLDDATLKCWGEGSTGRLGHGASNDLGDGPGEMGNSLPVVLLGSGRTAAAIGGGGTHTCAVLDNGQVKCWGGNTQGQLGYGDTATRGDAGGEMGDNLLPVDLGTGRTATGISAGLGHTCALLDLAMVKCWGGGSAGQLGYGDTATRGDGPAEMGDNLPAVNLGAAHTPVAITSGRAHECAVLDDGSIRCWGANVGGRLGVGDLDNRGDGPGEMGDNLPPVQVGTVEADIAVTLTRDQTEVVAGQTITYHVTVTNTGGRRLTDVDVLAPDVPNCVNGTVSLGVGAVFAYSCTYTTTGDDVPQMNNQVLVTTDQGVSALSGNRRTRVAANTFQPDGRIRLGAGATVGDGIYNTNASGQARSATVGNLGTATFTATVQNDGNTATDIRVQGLGSTSRFTVAYKDGVTDVTAAVVAGIHQLGVLAPGATHDLTITIRAKAGTRVGTSLSRTLTATSLSDTTRKDAVKATVARR